MGGLKLEKLKLTCKPMDFIHKYQQFNKLLKSAIKSTRKASNCHLSTERHIQHACQYTRHPQGEKQAFRQGRKTVC